MQAQAQTQATIEYESGYNPKYARVEMDMKVPAIFRGNSNLVVMFDPALQPPGEEFGTNISGRKAKWPFVTFVDGAFRTKSSRLVKMLKNHPSYGTSFHEVDRIDIAMASGEVIATKVPDRTEGIDALILTVKRIPRKADKALEMVGVIKQLTEIYGIVNMPPLSESSSLTQVSAACWAVMAALETAGVIDKEKESE